ncbi:MAG: hypothetical protein ABID38_03570 [Candidatus Diapherotrites archaeon]
MKKLILILAVLFGMIFLTSSVSAWFVGVGWDGGYLEVYRDGYWANSPDPYDYYYDNWYYYQEPYRYNYGGDYYYYEPGWYNYDYSWYSNPYSYSYYNSNYYYYDNYWSYYPGWYNYPSIYGYYGGSNSLVGSSYQYPKLADCSEIELNVYDKSIRAGDMKEVTVWVNNYSIKNFQINSVSVYLDSFDLDKGRENYDSTVAAGKSGQITFEIEADNDAKSNTVNGNVKITGQFTDGTVCSGGDIDSEKFRISISGATKTTPAPATNAAPAFAYSTSTIVERSGEGGWVDVSPEREAMVEGVTFEELESGDYIRFVEEDNYIEGSCDGLGFVPLSINLQGGEGKTEYLYLRNYTYQNFYIDSVDVYDYSPSFASSPGPKDSMVYSDSRGKIGISIDAYSSYEDDYGTLYVKARGHFPSGKTCSLSPQKVDVYVNNNLEKLGCDAFNFSVPDVLRIESNGEIDLVIDNPSDKGATITLVADDLDLSSKSIYLGPESLLEKTIYVSNFSGERSFIFYNIDIEGCSFSQRVTVVKRPVADEEPTGEGVELLNVASKINIGDSAMVPVSIRNNLDEDMFVELKIIDLPDGFYARQIIEKMPAKSSKNFNLEVFSGDAEAGTYSGKLVVSAGNKAIIRNIEFNVVKSPESGESVEQEEGIVSAGMVSTALAILGGGTLIAGVIIIGLLIVLFIIGAVSGPSKRMKKNAKAPESPKKA